MLARRLVSIAAAAAVAISPATAGPALLFDIANGRVIYAEDQDDQWFPASLAKIMTAYLVFEALRDGKLKPDDKITVSELAHSQIPSRIGLPVGAEIRAELALHAVIVKSANDAAVMLAEAVSGSHEAFVERMNATAKRLGMTRTRFVNANGTPAPEQVTTARDLARLTVAVTRDFPNHAQLWSMPEMQIGKRRMRNHNPLLRNYDGADGMKTGFICDSGFNIVATATRDGHRMVAVVLGEISGSERSMRAANLLEHGFRMHAWKATFGSPTIETLPAAAEPKAAASIRSSVKSWACGTGRRVARGKRKRAKAAAAKQAPGKAGTEKAGAPKAKAAPGPQTAKAKAGPASQKASVAPQ
jgi:D-alanyl-D-alanine carboxypeptidase